MMKMGICTTRGSVIKHLARKQQGATALETAIILVAFVVVASLFAYVVIKTGIFADARTSETVSRAIDQVTGAIELVGDPKADGVLATKLSSADDAGAWTEAGNVTANTETSDRKEGTAAVDLVIAGAFTNGMVAHENLASTVNLSQHLAAGLWIQPSTPVADGVFQLVLDDSVGCGSPEESLDIDALTTDTWHQVHMQLANPTLLSAVACVGINATSDPGAMTVSVDLIQGPSEVQTVYLAVNSAIPTQAVAFEVTPDTDSDGLLQDEANQQNNLVITFVNDDALVRNIAWTFAELGAGDGDNELEYGETFQLTIDLRGVDPIPTAKALLGLELEAHGNAFMTIERRIPRNIERSMILR